MATQQKDMKTYYCEKCNKTMDATQFYVSNNLEKYPNNGKLNWCKKCMTMHVDNWKPETYLWILQEADVPYIPDEWNKLLSKYAQDPSKVSGMTIVGRYLSKMKLKQYCDFRWKDTEFLKEVKKKEREETMRDAGYDIQDIIKANERADFQIPENLGFPDESAAEANPHLATGDEDYFGEIQDDDVSSELDLTPEDRLYLRLKWGKNYKPEEWVRLEQLYTEMTQSYDIQTAAHIDNLKLLCKTSLKANQLIDINDIEGYQKMSKVYETQMKSGNFTAAQNKNERGDQVDSLGELVALCETQGFIPKYYTSGPQDKVDETIRDMQRYTKTLITEETNISNLVEKALRDNEREDANDVTINDEDIDIFESNESAVEEVEKQLKDDDFMDYSEFLDNESATDADILRFLAEEKEGI